MGVPAGEGVAATGDWVGGVGGLVPAGRQAASHRRSKIRGKRRLGWVVFTEGLVGDNSLVLG